MAETSLSEQVRSEALPEAQPTPLTRFSESMIPEFKEAGAATVAGLRESATRKRAEAVTEQQTRATEQAAAGASRATVTEARERAAAQPPLDTTARPFLAPGKGFLDQMQAAILGVTQVALGFGGLKGGGHAIAAVAGLKGALEGWQAGDHERANRALVDWKAAANKLQNDLQNRLELHRDLLTDQKTSMDNRLALIGMRASADGDDTAANLAKQGNIKGLIEHYDKQDEVLAIHGLRRDGLNQAWDKHREDAAERVRHNKEAEATAHDMVEIRRDAAEREKPMKAAERIKLMGPIEAAESAVGMLNDIEAAAGRLGKLLPSNETRMAQWEAGIRRWAAPGTNDLITFKQLWGPVMIGMIDRGAFDEKGIRAMAAFKAQIDATDNIPPKAALADLMATLRTSMIRKAEQRQADLEDIGDEKLMRRGRVMIDRLKTSQPTTKTPVLVGPDRTKYDGTGVDPKTLKPGWRLE